MFYGQNNVFKINYSVGIDKEKNDDIICANSEEMLQRIISSDIRTENSGRDFHGGCDQELMEYRQFRSKHFLVFSEVTL